MTRAATALTIVVNGPGSAERVYQCDTEQSLDECWYSYRKSLVREGWTLQETEERRAPRSDGNTPTIERRRGEFIADNASPFDDIATRHVPSGQQPTSKKW